jgi:hypothetical protein
MRAFAAFIVWSVSSFSSSYSATPATRRCAISSSIRWFWRRSCARSCS